MAAKKVVVVGGGVAGMSAAHELIRRGYQVEVYERNALYCGGKARSIKVPDSNKTNPDKHLPGEHGFRFFPGFYKHITATMREIPFKGPDGQLQKDGCFGNLVPTTRIMLAQYGKEPILTVARFPKSISDIRLLVREFLGADTGLSREEEVFFSERMWQLMTSSHERRDNEYEKIGWWDYLQADRFSKAYQTLLAAGLTRTLVAAQAKTASTRTGGGILLQLLFNMAAPGKDIDLVLNAPTNEAWLNPWLEDLQERGVQYHFGQEATSLQVEDGRIVSVLFRTEDGEETAVEADYFVLAVPVEQAAPLMNHEITQLDSSLQLLQALAKNTNWMNGIQYYLNTNVDITNGHCIYADSEWALTSISQLQFWKDYDLSEHYNGNVKGVLSVDISDWTATKYKGKLAKECAPDEVADYVWEQLEKSLNVNGRKVLDRSMIEHYYLDQDIRWDRDKQENTNEEPLLINRINTWRLRPEAVTNIPNLFLASDYVRTHTDLASMEGANEAARRAVNGLLEMDGSSAPRCPIYPLEEPWFFKPFKWLDKKRYQKGKPYSFSTPWWLKPVIFAWGGAYLVLYSGRMIVFWISSPIPETAPA